MIVSIATISLVFQQGTLNTVDPVGLLDGALQNNNVLLNKKKWELISWEINTGKFRLWVIDDYVTLVDQFLILF